MHACFLLLSSSSILLSFEQKILKLSVKSKIKRGILHFINLEIFFSMTTFLNKPSLKTSSIRASVFFWKTTVVSRRVSVEMKINYGN